jgi:hypothetical protein
MSCDLSKISNTFIQRLGSMREAQAMPLLGNAQPDVA